MKATPHAVQTHRREWFKAGLLPKAVRRLVFALAVPALIGGCAHDPGAGVPAEQATAKPDKRVFRVAPSPDAQRHMDTYAETLPELADSFSSAAIIQHILAQHKKLLTADTLHLRPRGAKGSALNTASITLPDMRGFKRGKFRGNLAGNAKFTSKAAFRKGRGPRDHWETVRNNLVLASVDHALVDAQLQRLRANPGAVNFLMKRAEPYLGYLLGEIEKSGLPADLVIVPMVESAFEINAVSPKQAAGMWQFIPSTGQRYGLEVSANYDGRYDVHASTQAALKYLKFLNKLFNGDWMLAFAAYNAGEGAVQRAIEASRKAGESGSFWDLRLPAETHAYVLKIVSLARAIADPKGYGYKPQGLPAESYLTRVELGSEMGIPEVIALSGMTPDEFYRLNPSFKNASAAMSKKPRSVLMPSDKAEVLVAGDGPSPDGSPQSAMLKVVVKPGETLAILAKRHGVPELKLAEWNKLRPKAPLKPGRKLVVYSV